MEHTMTCYVTHVWGFLYYKYRNRDITKLALQDKIKLFPEHLLNFSAARYFSIASRLCFFLCKLFPSRRRRVASNSFSNDFASMSCRITFAFREWKANVSAQCTHFFVSCFSRHNLQNEWPHGTVTGSQSTPVQMPHCRAVNISLSLDRAQSRSILSTSVSPLTS